MYSKFDKQQVEIMKNQVETLKDELSKLRPLSPSELERLQEDFSIEFTYNSNAIEGGTITLDETFLLIKEGIVSENKRAEDQVEILSHYNLFIKLAGEVKSKRFISERLIKEIHSSLLAATKPDIAGEYRKINVGVGANVYNYYQAPHFSEVPQLMKDYVKKFLENKDNTISDFIEAHINFERIHPFVDGNGRTGRMLLNLQLIKGGYLPINVKFANIKDYINAFKNISKTNDRTYMHGIILNLEIEALQSRIDMIK